MSNETTTTTVGDRIAQLITNANLSVVPMGSFGSKKIIWRGKVIPLTYQQVGDTRLVLEAPVGILTDVVTDRDLDEEEHIVKAFRWTDHASNKSGSRWNFPYWGTHRPQIGTGLLRINQEKEGKKPLFFAEGFLNLGKLFKVAIYSDSLDFQCESEGDAFARTVSNMRDWRVSGTTLNILEEQFGVEVDHLRTPSITEVAS